MDELNEMIHKFKSLLVLLSVTSMMVCAQSGVSKDNSIAIGFLVNKQNEGDAKFGAQLAIDEINQSGGIHGRDLRLVTRSMEGSWGAGSAEVVDLVFTEKVSAILGSIDGRNSHVAEQVIAKTGVVYISAWASDPSLSKAYVPWYFSVVPTDDQQASDILNSIGGQKQAQKILVIHEESYDAEQALKSLKATSNRMKNRTLSSMSTASFNTEDFVTAIKSKEVNAIILLGRQLPLSLICNALQESGMAIPVYLSLSVSASPEYPENSFSANMQMQMIAPNPVFISTLSTYKKPFEKNNRLTSRAVSAYAYDGIKIIAAAMLKSNERMDSLRESLLKIKYQGVTGLIQFDAQGRLKNSGEVVLLEE